MIGRRQAGRHARRTSAPPPALTPVGGDVRPVVRLGFADGSVLLLGADDPLARALRALADTLVRPGE